MIFAAGSPQEAWRVFESHYAVKSEDERERVEDEWNEMRQKEGENRTSKNSESRYNTLPALKFSRPSKHFNFLADLYRPRRGRACRGGWPSAQIISCTGCAVIF